jgi:hypothetical protein
VREEKRKEEMTHASVPSYPETLPTMEGSWYKEKKNLKMVYFTEITLGLTSLRKH